MDFDASTLVAGLLGYGGQREANETNIQIANAANAANQQNAREQMAFQERMSSTAYQRATIDMQRAGINPMLAISQGGASSPSGAAGTNTAARVENELTPLMHSALQARQAKKQFEQVDSTIDLNNASKKTKETEADYNQASALKVQAETAKALAELPALRKEAEARKAYAEYEKEHPALKFWLGVGSKAASTAADVGIASRALKGSFVNPQMIDSARNEAEKGVLNDYRNFKKGKFLGPVIQPRH